MQTNLSRRSELPVRFGARPDAGLLSEGRTFERALFGEVRKIGHDQLAGQAREAAAASKTQISFMQMVDIVKRSQPPSKHIFLTKIEVEIKQQLLSKARGMQPADRSRLIRFVNAITAYTAVGSVLDDFYIAGPPSGRGGFGTMDAFIEIVQGDEKFLVTIDATRRDKNAIASEKKPAAVDVEIYGSEQWKDYGIDQKRFDQQVVEISAMIASVIMDRVQGKIPKMEPTMKRWPRVVTVS